MYLHIGQDTVVRMCDIVGIFDIDTTSISPITREYLRKAQESGTVVNVTEDLPKSFVVCRDSGSVKVYISQISSTTLFKRSLAKGFADAEPAG